MHSQALVLILTLAQGPIPVAADCVADPTRSAALPFCRAERYLRQFKSDLRGQPDNDRWLQLAIKELQGAAERARGTPDFVVALEKLIDLYAPLYLNDVTMAEPSFRAWIEASPFDIRPRLELDAMLQANGELALPSAVRDIKALEDPASPQSRLCAAFREKWRQPSPARAGPLAPVLVKHVLPAYPEQAREERVQGVVIVEARIDEAGKVVDARVLRSIPLLDAAAIEAVRQWEYQPTVVNGKAIPVIAIVTVAFTLAPE